MMNFFENQKRNLLILATVAIVNLFIYSQLFGFRPNNDTEEFIYTIQFFRDGSGPLYASRYLNPFYPLVGSTLLNFASPAESIVILNCLFYFGLVLLTYGLVRRVFKNNLIGLISAGLVMTNYAIVRYGLTQVQDIGGYFWFLLTIYCGWRWWEDSDWRWLAIGGVSTAFGVLTKESGAMGALFVGILMLLKNRKNLKIFIINFCIFSLAPAFTIAVNYFRGKDVAYSSIQWFIFAWKGYAAENYTLLRWAGVNATTFNIVWALFAFGLFLLIKNRKNISSDIKIFLLAMIPSSLSYFAWSLFISRTVFISAWVVIPVAAYAVFCLLEKWRVLTASVLVLVLALPYLLQILIGYTPLFPIIERTCHYSVSCSVKTFLKSRGNFHNFRYFSTDFIQK